MSLADSLVFGTVLCRQEDMGLHPWSDTVLYTQENLSRAPSILHPKNGRPKYAVNAMKPRCLIPDFDSTTLYLGHKWTRSTLP